MFEVLRRDFALDRGNHSWTVFDNEFFMVSLSIDSRVHGYGKDMVLSLSFMIDF